MGALPAIKVELDDGTGTFPYDITSKVNLSEGLSITRGRGDQFESVDPSTLSLAVDNSSGDFTLGDATYGIEVDQQIRVTETSSGNYLTAAQSSFESGTGGWAGGGTAPPTLTQSSAHPYVGSQGLLVTWGAGGTLPRASVTASGLTTGVTYTLSAWVWVPTGSPGVAMVAASQIGNTSSAKDTHVRISTTFVAAGTTQSCQIWPVGGAAAGQQVYVDAVQVNFGTFAEPFTLDPPSSPTVRFTGYVQDWPTTWVGSMARLSLTRISAVDRLARLERRQLRSMLEQEVLADGPFAYYTLSEPEGSTSVGDSSGNGSPSLSLGGSGLPPTFGSGTGPAADGLSAVKFNGGQFLRGSTGTDLSTGGSGLTIECFFNTTGSDETIFAALTNRVFAFVDFLGTVSVYVGTSAGFLLLSSPTSLNDGLTHHVAVQVLGGAVTLNIDGAVVDTDSAALPTLTGSNVRVGGGAHPDGFGGSCTGTISHFAIFTDSTAYSADRYEAGMTGFAGDSTDERLERLAGYAMLAPSDLAFEAGVTTVPKQSTSGASVLDAMRDVEAAELGALFIDATGDLVFQNRTHRAVTATSAATAAYSSEDVNTSDLVISADKQLLRNYVTGSREGGATQVALNAASIEQHEQYPETLSFLLENDDEVLALVQWRVGVNGVVKARATSLTIDLLTLVSAAVTVDTLAIELGDRITVASMPSQSPSSSLDLIVEGWTENLSDSQWSITFNTVPADDFRAWVLGDATYGALGTTTRLYI